MNYEIDVLLMNEDSFKVEARTLTEVDILIPILGNKMSEVRSLTVYAVEPNLVTKHLIHTQSFA